MAVNSRAWLYPALVTVFVALIAVMLHQGERRSGDETAAERRELALADGTPDAATAAASPQPPGRPAHAATATPWEAWRTNAAQPLARLILQIS